jgi:hypothetical protein
LLSAFFFSSSKFCPAIVNSFRAASTVIQPSMFEPAHVLVGCDGVEFLAEVPLHDRERIRRRHGLVHDQHRRRSLPGPFLELVGPAPVVGHRLAAEHLRVERRRVGGIGDRRIVDEDDDGLALDVDVLEVVPAELRRLDAVAGEDDVRLVDLRAVGHVLRPRDHVVFPRERQLLRALREDERLSLRAGDADERDLLDVGAVRVARLEAEILELRFEVADRQVLADAAGRASLELVGGEHLDVLEDHRGIELRHRRQRNRRRRQRPGRDRRG